MDDQSRAVRGDVLSATLCFMCKDKTEGSFRRRAAPPDRAIIDVWAAGETIRSILYGRPVGALGLVYFGLSVRAPRRAQPNSAENQSHRRAAKSGLIRN